ncbi:MAG: TIR domain-containing protein [Chloroflexi bacterium]|nr:TIR domain-containing protein [Chloroflexota bacterium]
MAETNQGTNGKVFISYSRRDKAFVKKLNSALDAAGVQAWVDWEGIQLASDWMATITSAIQGSDAFLFVISPDSLKSKVCAEELELGLKLNKKLIPVLYREPEKGTAMHERLAGTNWVYLRKQDKFTEIIPRLVESINTDLEWVRQHTRLLERALEWERKNKNNSFLLVGTDLEDAERWMSEAATKPNRQVLPLQVEYIRASRAREISRQRSLLVGVSLALVVSIVLGVLALIARNDANEQRKVAVTKQAEAEAAQLRAEQNELYAKQEEARAEQNQQLAEEKQKEAEEKTNLANAQRSAALSQIYQSRAGELDTSTLLAIDSYLRDESFLAENLLRINASLMPIPVAQMKQDGGIFNIEWDPEYEYFVTGNKTDDALDSAARNQACVWRASDGAQRYCVLHDDDVNDALYSPDGKYLITGSTDKTLRIWNAADGSLVKQFDFPDEILDLDIHDNLLAVSRKEQTLTVIDLDNLELPSAVRNFNRNAGASAVKFSPDGRFLAFGMTTGKVMFWRVGQNSQLFYDGPVHTNSNYVVLAFSNDSAWLASGGGDSIARLTKNDGSQRETIPHGDWVEDVAFSPDNSWFVTVSDDEKVRVVETDTGNELLRMSHTDFVQKVEVSRDGQWIASTGYDEVVRIWDSASGDQMLEFPLDSIGSAIAFNHDASRVIAADEDGNISIWDTSALASRVANIQFPEFLHEARFTPSGETLIVNSDDYRIWGIPTGDMTRIKDGRQGRVILTADNLTYDTAISPDSKWIAAVEFDSANTQNNRGILVSLDGRIKFPLQHGGEVTGIGFSSDSQYVITSGANGIISFWDVNTGERRFDLKQTGKAYSLSVSPVGTLIAVGLHDGIAIWDFATQAQVAELSQSGDIEVLTFNQDGTWLASGSSEGNVFLWKVEGESFTQTGSSLLLDGVPQALSFSTDNRWLAGGGSSGYAYLWDVAAAQELNRIHHNDPVTSITFSPDGTLLFTVSRKVVRIWEVASLPLIPRDQLVDFACTHLTSNLSTDEWRSLLGEDEPYRPLCPDLPVEE